MAKGKKQTTTPKPRPDKYAEKVTIAVYFEQAMHLFAAHANKVVEDRSNEPTVQEPHE